MELKIFDQKALYNIHNSAVDGKIITKSFVDPFNISQQDLLYILENSVGQYTEDNKGHGTKAPQFICPNGVACADIVDALKTIYKSQYKKAIRNADEFIVLFTDIYFETEREFDEVTGKYSDPKLKIKYVIEFNTDEVLGKEDVEKLFACRDAALKYKAKKEKKEETEKGA